MANSVAGLLDKVDAILEPWWNKLNEGSFKPNQREAFEVDATSARKLIDQALDAEPTNDDAIDASARWHLVVAWIQSGFTDDAEMQEAAAEHMKEVIRRHPEDASFRGMLAECYKHGGKKDMAIAELQKGLEIDPGNAVLQGELQKLQGASKGCFVATAVYASPVAPEVLVLRAFRDRVLLRSVIGSAFVTVYYNMGPLLGKFIDRHQKLRKPIRVLVLDPIVRSVARWMGGST